MQLPAVSRVLKYFANEPNKSVSNWTQVCQLHWKTQLLETIFNARFSVLSIFAPQTWHLGRKAWWLQFVDNSKKRFIRLGTGFFENFPLWNVTQLVGCVFVYNGAAASVIYNWRWHIYIQIHTHTHTHTHTYIYIYIRTIYFFFTWSIHFQVWFNTYLVQKGKVSY